MTSLYYLTMILNMTSFYLKNLSSSTMVDMAITLINPLTPKCTDL